MITKFKAIALAASSIVMMGAAAQAADVYTPMPEPMPAYTGGWYFGAFGGTNWLDDTSFDIDLQGPTPVVNAYDSGSVVGGAIGYDFGQAMGPLGMRVEAELSYRNNSIKSHSIDGGAPVTGSAAFGDTSALAGMANMLFDLNTGSPITIYGGGGIGFANVEFDGHGVADPGVVMDDDDTVFAWQAIAGIGYELSPGLIFDVHYRYFNAGDVLITSGPFTSSPDYESHAVLGSVRFNFSIFEDQKPDSTPPAPEPSVAQEINNGTSGAQGKVYDVVGAPSSAEAVNNGTNPTLLSTTMGIQYQYTHLGDGLDAGLLEAYYTQPFGEKGNMAWTSTLEFAHGPIDQDIGLGDFNLKFTHVPIVTAEYGAAYTVRLYFDTAERPELGDGQTSVEISAFYAKFFEDGSIFAPALVHQFGLGDTDPGQSYVNISTIDFYYVPKLPNPNYYVTLDPALIRDWEAEKNYASLQVTMGMLTGKLLGGDSQIFIKPGLLLGGGEPAIWSVQAGFKIIGF